VKEKDNKHPPIVQAFIWLWLFGSVLVSAYFAFCLFPEIYDLRNGRIVTLYFQTRKGDDTAHIIYYPNSSPFRKHYGSVLDKETLYYSRCAVLPLSQRPNCDSTANWRGLDPKSVGCSGVATCKAETYRLSELEWYSALEGVRATLGDKILVGDLAPLSLSDPVGWGHAARWPIFFVSLFLGIKLGRALGEFAFAPYDK
jgi:hypothetical protein